MIRRSLSTVRRLFHLVRLEIVANWGVLLLPVMIVFAWYQVERHLVEPAPTWLQASRVVGLAGVYVAPFTATLATWLATRDRYSKTDEAFAAYPVTPQERGILIGLGAAFWGWSGMLGIFAWVSWLYVPEHAWGLPNPLLIGIGGTTVLLGAMLGALAGTIVGNRYAAPIVGVLFALGSAMPSYWDNPGQSLSPWQFLFYNRIDVFRGVTSKAALPQLWFLVGLTGLLTGVLYLWGKRALFPGGILAFSLVIAAGGSAAAMADVDAIEGLETETPYCRLSSDDKSLTLCVHPAYARLTPEMDRLLSSTFSPVRGLHGVPDTFSQVPPGEENSAPTGTLPFSMDDDPSWQFGFVYQVSTRYASAPPPSAPAGEAAYGMSAPQIVLQHWLITYSGLELPQGYSPGFTNDMWAAFLGEDRARFLRLQADLEDAIGKWMSLPLSQQRSWVGTHYHAVYTGTATLADMP